MGGGSIKIGGSTGGSISFGGGASGSASSSTKAVVKITGTCPQAVNMGLTQGDPNTQKGAGGCSYLKHSCCTTKSMSEANTNWKKNMNNLGYRLWSSTRVSTAAAVLMANLSQTAQDCKTATPATPVKKRLRNLQAMKVGGSVGGSAGVKTGGSVKIGGSTGVKTGGSVKIGGSASGSTGVKTSGSAKAGGSAKSSGSVKINIKIGSGSSSSKPKPSAWNLNSNCRDNFVGAFNASMTAASSRKAVNSQAKECMTALYKMKASMTCMSCDPTNEKALQSDFDVTSSGYTNDFMTKCATYLSIYKDYKSMVTTVVTYASTVTTSTALSTAMTNLNAITSAQTGWVDACMSTTPATPATPAKTPPATPAKTEA